MMSLIRLFMKVLLLPIMLLIPCGMIKEIYEFVKSQFVEGA